MLSSGFLTVSMKNISFFIILSEMQLKKSIKAVKISDMHVIKMK